MEIGGKGGGKPTAAQGQGSEIEKIGEAIEKAKMYVKQRIIYN